MKLAPKTLFLDIENSLNIYAAYPSKREQFLRSENLLQDWFIICAAWQWEIDGKLMTASLLDNKKAFKKNPLDDYHLTKTLRDLLAEADIVVGHNMKKHDFAKIKARIIHYGLEPLPPIKVLDTLTEARRASFSHNDLRFLAKKFNVDAKLEHPKDMWLRILRGDESAVKEAIKYCKGDIPPLVGIYKRLKPYMPAASLLNMNLWRGDGIECCPNCGGENLNRNKNCVSRTGFYTQYKCKDCGAYCSGIRRTKAALLK